MKISKDQVKTIIDALNSAEYTDYAKLLSARVKQNEVFKVAVIGEMLTGKSTIINKLLGKDLLPTSIIPTDTKIKIVRGTEDMVDLGGNETAAIQSIDELCDSHRELTVKTDAKLLNELSMEITELPGYISKRKNDDIILMTPLYEYDAVIAVVGAEHMFSEIECEFIKNYCKYADKNRLIVAVNRMALIDESERERIREFANGIIESRFKDVKNVFVEDKYDTEKGECTGYELLREMLCTMTETEADLDNSVKGINEYIKEKLDEDLRGRKREQDRINNSIDEEKSRLQTEESDNISRIEICAGEFLERKRKMVAKANDFLKNAFEKIKKQTAQKLDGISNKSEWCKNKLSDYLEAKIDEQRKMLEAEIMNGFGADIEWLNNQFKTEFIGENISIDVDIQNLDEIELPKDYSSYKKYTLIGTTGVAITGFTLLTLFGQIKAAIILAGGIIAGGTATETYLNSKEKEQFSEVSKNIELKIDEISYEIRRGLEKEIDKLYKGALEGSKNEAMTKLRSYYNSKSFEYHLDEKISKIEKIMELL